MVKRTHTQKKKKLQIVIRLQIYTGLHLPPALFR